MAKKIEEYVKELEEREEKLKLELSSSTDEARDKLKRVGKIAFISGIVAIAGYWIYRAFFAEEKVELDEEKPKKIANRTKGNSISSRLTTLAMPYIQNIINDLINNDMEEETKTAEEETD